MEVQVEDSNDPPQMDTLSFEFNVVNNPPKINSIGYVSTSINEMFIYDPHAVDPDNNEIFFNYSNYPSWLVVADSLLLGNVPVTATDTSFSLMISDGELKDSINVIIIVQDASLVNSLNMPTDFKLYNNYPNPFNPMTSIKIDIPHNTKVELYVYDVNGRLVDELYNGQLNAGVHTASWNAYNQPSGIYFIQFKSDAYNDVIKCTLLK